MKRRVMIIYILFALIVISIIYASLEYYNIIPKIIDYFFDKYTFESVIHIYAIAKGIIYGGITCLLQPASSFIKELYIRDIDKEEARSPQISLHINAISSIKMKYPPSSQTKVVTIGEDVCSAEYVDCDIKNNGEDEIIEIKIEDTILNIVKLEAQEKYRIQFKLCEEKKKYKIKVKVMNKYNEYYVAVYEMLVDRELSRASIRIVRAFKRSS